MDQKVNPPADGPEDEPEVEISVTETPEFLKAVERGLAQSELGEYIPGDEAVECMVSWVNHQTLMRPQIRVRLRR